jgi:hypothetical protein
LGTFPTKIEEIEVILKEIEELTRKRLKPLLIRALKETQRELLLHPLILEGSEKEYSRTILTPKKIQVLAKEKLAVETSVEEYTEHLIGTLIQGIKRIEDIISSLKNK